MQKRCLTLIEILVIVTIILIVGIIIIDPEGLGHNHRKIALSRACSNNLAQIGKAKFQYENPSNFDATPMRVPPTSGNEGANGTTLAPLVALFAAGMLDKVAIVTCPVSESGWSVVEADKAGLGLKDQQDTVANSLVTSSGEHAASHYLFTRYYKKKCKSSRVIAADAAGIDETGKSGFSPNHGFDGSSSWGKTANALFWDNHIKTARSDFTVEGSIDPTNLWDDIDPPTQTDLTKTQIGHY